MDIEALRAALVAMARHQPMFELDADRQALVLVWHHLMGDGWSSRILNRELVLAYREALSQRNPVLPPFRWRRCSTTTRWRVLLRHCAALRRIAKRRSSRINAGGTLPPFVFLHGDFMGGGFYSRALAHWLGPDQPVLIVHLHGLVEASVPPTIEAMAADRIHSLRAMRPHGPYVLGGHCNDAFVAFEMARQLRAAGEAVPLVILIEAREPRDGAAGDGAAGAEAWWLWMPREPCAS